MQPVRAIWGSQGEQKFLQIPVIWDLSHSAHIRQGFVWDQWPRLDQNHPSPTCSTEDVFLLLVGWSYSHFCLFLFPSRDSRITIGKTIPRMIPAWYQRSQNAQMKTLQMFCEGAGALLKMADFPAQTFHPTQREFFAKQFEPHKKTTNKKTQKTVKTLWRRLNFSVHFKRNRQRPGPTDWWLHNSTWNSGIWFFCLLHARAKWLECSLLEGQYRVTRPKLQN